MRNYLARFFERFDYPQKAQKELIRTYELVQEDAEAKALFDGCLAEYKSNTHCDFGAQIRNLGDLGRRLPTSP